MRTEDADQFDLQGGGISESSRILITRSGARTYRVSKGMAPPLRPRVRPFVRTSRLLRAYCAAFADAAPARVYVITIASFRELASGPISIFITNELGFQSE
jgi:hypothetical protein